MNKRKIVITGAQGMLGQALVTTFNLPLFEVYALGRKELDITNENQVQSVLKEISPEVVINSAAYTNVEDAEDEGSELNNLVNNQGVKYLAEATNTLGISFIHVSTDYVFTDNQKEGKTESDSTEKGANAYGEAKRKGELAALEANQESYILRTSWLYGEGGENLVDTIVRLAKERDSLAFVEDEIGVPTYTKDLAELIAFLIIHIEKYEPGIYHAVNEGSCSRYEQARLILDVLQSKTQLGKSKLADFSRKAHIPNYSILKNTKLPALRSWEYALTEYILENHF